MQYLPIAVGYLLGSIPFGLLAGKLAGKDIRKEGSGNIGATNVVRVCGWKVGLPVFALDVLKGFVPVFWISPALSGEGETMLSVLTGIAAILGHTFPVWLRFKGGKGVATSAGVVGALMPVPFGIALAAFLLTVLLTRYVSLGSMLASVVLVVAQIVAASDPFGAAARPLTGMACLLCVLVILRHRGNVARLLAGTESKIGKGGAQTAPVPDAAEEANA